MTYLVVMLCTNAHFTILDDEANSIAIAGRPIGAALYTFFSGSAHRELHPPLTELVWHAWMKATNYSFFFLRVLANIFYIGAAFFTGKCAEKLAGRKAYWLTLLLALGWPFSFQYGRIAGWYTLSAFLLSVVTWTYLHLMEDGGRWWWASFTFASILLVWSSYFGFVFLLLLLSDMLIFHREVATRYWRRMMVMGALIALAFIPLLRVASADVGSYVGSETASISLKQEIATIGYPVFALAGSSAVAPWYWPLSVPVLLAAIGLIIALWRSDAKRWLIYVLLAMSAMDAARVFDIKRTLFFLPWIFLMIGISMCGEIASRRRMATGAVAVMMLAGWIGIASGRHYATTNLQEPWGSVARMVAQDARHGATIVAATPPFSLYLDYQLGLQNAMGAADGSNLGDDVYRAHGYKVVEPADVRSASLRGKVVLVKGTGLMEDVTAMHALDASLNARCSRLGEFRAAPDPAIWLKRRFTRNVPLLAYRTDVIWYDCSN